MPAGFERARVGHGCDQRGCRDNADRDRCQRLAGLVGAMECHRGMYLTWTSKIGKISIGTAADRGMKPLKLRACLARLYFEINLALWAALLAGIVFFFAFVAPDIPAIQRRAATAEAARFIGQCSFYCEKWGFARGSLKHSQCMQDLKQFRREIQKGLDLLP